MKDWGNHNLGTRTPECVFERWLLSKGATLEKDSRVNAYEPGPRVYDFRGQPLWYRLYNTANYITYFHDWEVPQTQGDFEMFERGEWRRTFYPR